MQFKARWCRPNRRGRAAVVDVLDGPRRARYIAGNLDVGLGGRIEGDPTLARAVTVYAELFLGVEIWMAVPTPLTVRYFSPS